MEFLLITEESETEYYVPHRGADGSFIPVETVGPMVDGNFIGGFHPNMRPSTPAPPLPPKDDIYTQPGYHVGRTPKSSVTSSNLTTMSAIERSQALRMPRMDPHLQFMVGPLLRYDTVEDGVWYGAVMIVTADSGSVYEPHPTLSFEWDPDAKTKSPLNSVKEGRPSHPSFDLGPHPADRNVSHTLNGLPSNGKAQASRGPNAQKEEVPAHEIWVYAGHAGTSTFWRFHLEIPLGPFEMAITYSINNGQPTIFHVPGINQNMRWAAYSVDRHLILSGYDPVWIDLLHKHAEQPFHALVGGGDQIYCDGLTREPELQDWINSKPNVRKQYPLTDEISSAIDRFYFNHYCSQWRSGAFARANSTIPMMNMADIIDGFGSYPEDLQMAPIFRAIGGRGYFFFLLFQCFINGLQFNKDTVDVDGIDDRPGKHLNRSLIIGDMGPYVPFPSHSFLGYMGPQTYMLMLDCRAERTKEQVCSQVEYQKVFERLSKLPSTVEHLCVQIGIPIAYPRLVFLETALESKFNPLVALGRAGSMGLTSFVNKFNAEAELLDDLNDHWTARSHKKERNWFIEQLQKFAKVHRIRITFLSGDVHCAAVGVFKTLKGKKPEIPPSDDHRYMVNIVTSAIVNTPPPNGVITMVSSLATKNHKTLHHLDTDETMIPIFKTDTNDKPRKQKFIMGRRNWCQVDYDDGEWVFEIHVEREKGMGQTVGYSVRTPAPKWTPSS
ncbi:hypothetical protein B0H16DRAFT_1663119 [Mycena metata]|uniref:PhoD-like phosphatase domain-containing protein n=1 Tax=Mycena metata TaxID=1033252 RepID=A0AAD7NAC2_9AGAR|nr:hypothetical protein B0H16DRAFT_1663119 [Mycena metata]